MFKTRIVKRHALNLNVNKNGVLNKIYYKIVNLLLFGARACLDISSLVLSLPSVRPKRALCLVFPDSIGLATSYF